LTEIDRIIPCKVRFLRAEVLPESIFEPHGKTFFYEVLERGFCLNEPILERGEITQTQLKETLKYVRRAYKHKFERFPAQELCIVEEEVQP